MKSGVSLDGLAPAGARILSAIAEAAAVVGVDLTITNGTEGHGPTDPHTTGEAIDVRTAGLPTDVLVGLVLEVQQRLGTAFTVLYEVPSPSAVPDPRLLTVYYLNPGASASHLHIQRKKGTVYSPPSMAGRHV